MNRLKTLPSPIYGNSVDYTDAVGNYQKQTETKIISERLKYIRLADPGSMVLCPVKIGQRKDGYQISVPVRDHVCPCLPCLLCW